MSSPARARRRVRPTTSLVLRRAVVSEFHYRTSAYNVIQCHTMSYNVIQCHTMSYNVIQCHTMSYNVIQCHTMSYNVIQCHTMSYNVIQCHTMSYAVNRSAEYAWIGTETVNGIQSDVEPNKLSVSQKHWWHQFSNELCGISTMIPCVIQCVSGPDIWTWWFLGSCSVQDDHEFELSMRSEQLLPTVRVACKFKSNKLIQIGSV